MDQTKRLREELHDVRNERAKLMEERAALVDQQQQILDRCDRQDRDLTPPEQQEWDSLDAKVEPLSDRISDLYDRERKLADEAVSLIGSPSVEDRLIAMSKSSYRLSQTNAGGVNVFDDAYTRSIRMGQPNVVSHKLTLQAFKGREEDAAAVGHWLRALIGRAQNNINEDSERFIRQRGWGIQATATEGSNSGGGYLVPDPLTAAFIEERKRTSVAMQVCDVRSMTSDTLSIPRLTAGPTVSYPGEASAISPVDQTWGQIALTATKRGILEKISNELLADSVVDLAEQVASRMSYEFALQMDNEFINGDSTSTYGGEQGVLDAIGSAGVFFAGGASNSGVDTWPEITLSDLTGTMGLLTSEYRRDRCWLMSTSFYFEVALKLVAAAGGNTIASLAGGMSDDRPMLLGYPCYLTDWMPTSTGTGQKSALFGSFKQGVVIGDRQPLQVAVSTDRYFEEDVTALRGVSRYDLNVFLPGDANTAGAYVCLSTASS